MTKSSWQKHAERLADKNDELRYLIDSMIEMIYAQSDSPSIAFYAERELRKINAEEPHLPSTNHGPCSYEAGFDDGVTSMESYTLWLANIFNDLIDSMKENKSGLKISRSEFERIEERLQEWIDDSK